MNENKYEEIILYNISPEIIYSLKGFINCKIKILKKYNSSKYQFIKTFIIQLNYFIKMITLNLA